MKIVDSRVFEHAVATKLMEWELHRIELEKQLKNSEPNSRDIIQNLLEKLEAKRGATLSIMGNELFE